MMSVGGGGGSTNSVGGNSAAGPGGGGGGSRDREFTHDEVKFGMKKIIEAAFTNPANQARLKEARARSGSDMVKIMQQVFPVAMKIQQETLHQCGYPSDYEGVIKFTQMVHRYEKEDEELSSLATRFKTIFMPPLFSQQTSPPLPPHQADLAGPGPAGEPPSLQQRNSAPSMDY